MFFSLFILLRGRSRDEAFDIGREIVDAVTADNPKPVKLKFEKVCIPKFYIIAITFVSYPSKIQYLACGVTKF